MFFTLQDGTSNKRYKAVFYDRTNKKVKTIQFGDKRYENYTIHNDDKRKELYRKRHHRDNIDDPMTAGSLSWYLLWNKQTLQASITDYEQRFNMKYICL
tara:strand:+ start:2425 stop:2721 length:297 start_codon:yes stop_codon:yes gene_type:complete